MVVERDTILEITHNGRRQWTPVKAGQRLSCWSSRTGLAEWSHGYDVEVRSNSGGECYAAWSGVTTYRTLDVRLYNSPLTARLATLARRIRPTGAAA